MDPSKKITAEEVLDCIFTSITVSQDWVVALRQALAGEGLRAPFQDETAAVFFRSQLDPTYFEDQLLWDALEPNTVIIYGTGPISEGITGEEEFIYAYPCDEFCDKLQQHLDRIYYPHHPLMVGIVQPLVKQLRTAMPDPGVLPSNATQEEKIHRTLNKWLEESTHRRLYNGTRYWDFPERLASIAQGEDPYMASNINVCFPWTAEDPKRGTQPSAPSTIRLIARGQDARLVCEENPFVTILSGDKFCDMVQEWLVTNWYPDHQDEQTEVETSLTDLRKALTAHR